MVALEKTQAVPLSEREDGSIHLTRSRVTLDTLVACYQQGDSAEEIAEAYPSLTLGQIYGVIAYYLERQDSVHDYLRRRETSAKEIRAGIESEFPTTGLRARLLARRKSKIGPGTAHVEPAGG